MLSRRSICLFAPLACLAAVASCTRLFHKQSSTHPATSAPAAASAPALPQIAQLIVEVTGLRNARGQLIVSVYDRAAGFPSDPTRALMMQIRAIDPRSNGPIRLGFPLPPGHYAVAVIHDENRTVMLNAAGSLGMPSAGVGMSNNPKPQPGRPRFEAARFELPATGMVVRVGVRYF